VDVGVVDKLALKMYQKEQYHLAGPLMKTTNLALAS
jgi:hypothetical protein